MPLTCNGGNTRNRVGKCPKHGDVPCSTGPQHGTGAGVERNMVLNDQQWYTACLDTPLTMRRCLSASEAFYVAGCCVKSRERETTDAGRPGFPKHHGKLVSYDATADKVLVRGHGDAVSPKFVWRGTRAEYVSLWECD